jgi:septum formation protein
VKVLPDIEETYPEGLPTAEIPLYIAAEKAAAYKALMKADDLIITADTVVVLGHEVLGKPADLDDARRMLHELSGRTHQVITGVCLTSLDKQRVFAVTTGVTFKQFTEQEIDYYVSHYHPLDKAGAYGIQEWIGHIGVTALNGSYFNVMGLPVQRIYMEMQDF